MKSILVPTDFSEYAMAATRVAADMAANTGAKLILLHNVTTLLTRWEGLSRDEQELHTDVISRSNNAQLKFYELMDELYIKDLDVQTIITYGITKDQVIKQAQLWRVDIIVIGSHRNTENGRNFIESNIQKIIRDSSCPVLAIKQYVPGQQWDKLPFPASFDADVTEPFEQIKSLAMKLGSAIKLLYVNRPGKFKSTDVIQAEMEEFISRYPEIKFEMDVYDHDDLETGILKYAEESKPDYIVMISHPHKHEAKYLLSTTDTVVYHAEIPVLTVIVRNERQADYKKKNLADKI